jgi:hypothetical protein
MPENTVYVGRGSKWGNPFKVGIDGTVEQCIYLYKRLLSGDVCVTSKATIHEQMICFLAMKNALHELKGKNLACWCKEGNPCHGDILLKIASEVSGD